MNLHGHLIENNIEYGSKESIEFVDAFMESLNYYSLLASAMIASDKKETFHGFEGSKYHTGEYFDKYIKKEDVIISDSVRKALGNVVIPTAENWNDLKNYVMENGLYHSYRLAIAP